MGATDIGLTKGLTSDTTEAAIRVDQSTHAQKAIDYAHSEIHSGNNYILQYSVTSLGAMTSPDDTITLTFTTPNTTKWMHLLLSAKGTAGWRVRFIEAPTGGAASATGTLTVLNSNRNSSNTPGLLDLASAVGKVSYDATLATGGTTVVDEYIPGAVTNQSTGVGGAGGRSEIILKQNTKYQLSIYGTDSDPATLKLDFYEHTNKEEIA